ncbi:MAG: antitoxin [Fusobacterium sp.]|nr:antitoxin [Fusobacterium sp.]
MSTISLRMNPEDINLLKNYVKMNNLSLSEFVRNTILDKIEDDLALNEKRILSSWEEAKNEEGIPLEKVVEGLGL